jgi:predicted HTH domain antitoxin
MQITLEIPDQYINQQNQNQIAAQIKLYTALLMFQSEQLSRGAACEFASVDIYQFLKACKQHHISVINTTAETIEADVLRFQQRQAI